MITLKLPLFIAAVVVAALVGGIGATAVERALAPNDERVWCGPVPQDTTQSGEGPHQFKRGTIVQTGRTKGY